jgi:hypothetical protein
LQHRDGGNCKSPHDRPHAKGVGGLASLGSKNGD